MDQTAPAASTWGICDMRQGDMVNGWAWRPGAPEAHVDVEQWVDGVLAVSTAADHLRGDLLEAGIGHGHYGWAMRLALDPAKSGPQLVELRIKGGELLVNGSFSLLVEQLAEAPSGPVTTEDVDRREAAMNGWFDRDTNELAPGFPITPGDVVVDVGSGDGQMAGFCAQVAAETILIDSDEAHLDLALSRLRRRVAGRIEGRVADASKLPLADGMASRVICTEVLEHVDDPRVAMAELVRIGRPGALYLLSVPGEASERLLKPIAAPSYFEKPNHIRTFEGDEFPRLVEQAGLVIERRSVYGFYWAMWWMFFWQTPDGAPSHPLLESWNRTWWELLRTPDGARVKNALDGLLPKSNVLVARKPG